MRYKLRAECLHDACAYLTNVDNFRRCVILRNARFPDVEVTITTDLTLLDLINIANLQTDAHVIRETIETYKNYTGQRAQR